MLAELTNECFLPLRHLRPAPVNGRRGANPAVSMAVADGRYQAPLRHFAPPERVWSLLPAGARTTGNTDIARAGSACREQCGVVPHQQPDVLARGDLRPRLTRGRATCVLGVAELLPSGNHHAIVRVMFSVVRRLGWRLIDAANYAFTLSWLWLLDRIAGPLAETEADRVRERSKKRLQRAFPSVEIDGTRPTNPFDLDPRR